MAEAPGSGPGPMPRADFVTALVLIVLGAATVVESWRMPRLAERNIEPLSAPGIVPGLLGLVILALALLLLIRALRQGGARLFRPAAGAGAAGSGAEHGWGRLAATLGLTLLYAIGLVGRVPFWLATGLFVFAFVLTFEARTAGGAWRRTAMVALALAVAVSAAVTVVFQELFLVRLP